MIIQVVNFMVKNNFKTAKAITCLACIAYILGHFSQNNPAMQWKEYILSIEIYRKFKQHHSA